MKNKLEEKCDHNVVKELLIQPITDIIEDEIYPLGNCTDCDATITIGDKYEEARQFKRGFYKLIGHKLEREWRR